MYIPLKASTELNFKVKAFWGEGLQVPVCA